MHLCFAVQYKHESVDVLSIVLMHSGTPVDKHRTQHENIIRILDEKLAILATTKRFIELGAGKALLSTAIHRISAVDAEFVLIDRCSFRNKVLPQN
jgi:hypothetical protein